MNFSGLNSLIAENSSSAAPAISAAAAISATASADQQLLQQTTITAVAGKEMTDYSDNAYGNGNGKQSPPRGESDVRDW